MEDRELLRGVHKGDKECMNLIAEKYYDDIYRFCAYQTGNQMEAYDLAQETFLRFIRYGESCRYRNLKGYLLTIAANLCRNYFKAAGKRELYQEKQNSLVKPEHTGENQIENRMTLFDGLRQLPRMQREAVILHYYCEFRYSDIAKITGANVSTVKSRVKQGMEKLKKEIREEDFYG